MNETKEMEPTKSWRIRWLICLSEFADIDLQRRMWLDPKNLNPHWSYIEIMCSYFDDVLQGHGYAWAINEGYLTAEEAQAVAMLHRLLKQHKSPKRDDHDDEAILNDPAWHEIVKQAKSVKQSLFALLADPDEKRALLGDEIPE